MEFVSGYSAVDYNTLSTYHDDDCMDTSRTSASIKKHYGIHTGAKSVGKRSLYHVRDVNEYYMRDQQDLAYCPSAYVAQIILSVA